MKRKFHPPALAGAAKSRQPDTSAPPPTTTDKPTSTNKPSTAVAKKQQAPSKPATKAPAKKAKATPATTTTTSTKKPAKAAATTTKKKKKDEAQEARKVVGVKRQNKAKGETINLLKKPTLLPPRKALPPLPTANMVDNADSSKQPKPVVTAPPPSSIQQQQPPPVEPEKVEQQHTSTATDAKLQAMLLPTVELEANIKLSKPLPSAQTIISGLPLMPSSTPTTTTHTPTLSSLGQDVAALRHQLYADCLPGVYEYQPAASKSLLDVVSCSRSGAAAPPDKERAYAKLLELLQLDHDAYFGNGGGTKQQRSAVLSVEKEDEHNLISRPLSLNNYHSPAPPSIANKNKHQHPTTIHDVLPSLSPAPPAAGSFAATVAAHQQQPQLQQQRGQPVYVELLEEMMIPMSLLRQLTCM